MPPKTKAEPVVLTAEVLAVMDRAVRSARTKGWCLEFQEIAAPVFGVKANEVVDSDGFNCKGFDKDGFNSDGFNMDGLDKDGFNRAGYGRDGYNKEGYNRNGLNKDGFDAQGRDKYRYDYNGFDQDGYDSSGQRRRAERSWYAEQAVKSADEFKYDGYGSPRPAPRKTTAQKLIGK